MGHELKKGSLVRWIVEYEFYNASMHTGEVYPQNPIYNYGIIMEVSRAKSPYPVVVFCFQDGMWKMVNLIHDHFEVVSGA